MSFKEEWPRGAGEREERAGGAGLDLDPALEQALHPIGEDLLLEQALRNFRLSVHAWSEAEYSRVRRAGTTVRQRSWRLAAGWALGCVLVAGSVSGGVYERHQRNLRQLQEMKIAAARVAEQQRVAAEQRARDEEEDLLAKVDSDVSREAPSAMEPLAQLMAEDEAQ
jgi:DNA polymerase III psi subunit